jgi:hypothetical protein
MPLSDSLIPLDWPRCYIDVALLPCLSAFSPVDIINGVIVEIVHTVDIAHRRTRVGVTRGSLYLR